MVALYDYDTTIAGELPFKVGEKIQVISKATGDDQWWEGRSASGKVGQFPRAYVDETPVAAPAPAPAAAAPKPQAAAAAPKPQAAAAAPAAATAGLAKAGTIRGAPPKTAAKPAKPGTQAPRIPRACPAQRRP